MSNEVKPELIYTTVEPQIEIEGINKELPIVESTNTQDTTEEPEQTDVEVEEGFIEEEGLRADEPILYVYKTPEAFNKIYKVKGYLNFSLSSEGSLTEIHFLVIESSYENVIEQIENFNIHQNELSQTTISSIQSLTTEEIIYRTERVTASESDDTGKLEDYLVAVTIENWSGSMSDEDLEDSNVYFHAISIEDALTSGIENGVFTEEENPFALFEIEGLTETMTIYPEEIKKPFWKFWRNK